MIRFLKRKTRAFGREEDGNMTIEFVIVLPMIFAIFMMSFESGLLMMRSVMLERSVDMTMRELRLGQIPNATSAELKTRICSRTVIIANCEGAVRIEMIPVNLATWNMPTTAPRCVDRTQNVQPPETYNPGGQHELMLTRVCVLQRAIFPTLGLGDKFVGLGEGLTQGQPGGFGEYGLIVMSSFVNEPT
jgi:hypothetical protein